MEQIPLNLLVVPYDERQMIQVLPDNLAQELRTKELEAKTGEGELDLKGFWRLHWREILLSVIIMNPNRQIETIKALRAWIRARKGGVPILPVGHHEAGSLLFQPGHPRRKTVYIGHPAIPRIYYPMAGFHRFTFEHKLNEAIGLLMHLGATEIEAKHVQGWSREFSAKLDVPLPEGAAIGGQVGSKKNAQGSILFRGVLPGHGRPRLPEGMVWYEHEPSWRTVADGRLKFALQEFSLDIHYKDDFGINAGLSAKVEGCKLSLGGDFNEHTATEWKLTGKFAPVDPDTPSPASCSDPGRLRQ